MNLEPSPPGLPVKKQTYQTKYVHAILFSINDHPPGMSATIMYLCLKSINKTCVTNIISSYFRSPYKLMSLFHRGFLAPLYAVGVSITE